MSKAQPDQAAGLKTRAREDKNGARAVRVIAVTSGKGGVGKTNVVTNLAIALSRLGKKVLVMDADLSLANIDILLGLTPDYHIGHVLNGERLISEILVDGPAGITILPASSGWEDLTALDDMQKLSLLEQMDALDRDFEIVLVDTAAGIGNNVLYFNQAAQERVVVVTPEPTSLTDAYALIKVLSQHKEKYFRLLMNMVQDEKEAKDVYRKLAAVADRFLDDVSLDYLGFVPTDKNLVNAVRHQKALVEAYPQTPASKQIVKLGRTDKRESAPGRPGREHKILL